MKNFLLKDLNDTSKKYLKQMIQQLISEKNDSEELFLLNQKLSLLNKSLEETKIKRNYYFEKNRKREITEEEFERIMNIYEYEGYAFELEILLLEKDIFLKQNFIKRLKSFLMLLDTQDIDKMELFFGELVVNEQKRNLKIEQKILQLYLLYNNGVNYVVPTNDKFYLNKEEKEKIIDRLVLIREKIHALDTAVINSESFDLKNMMISDLLNQDSEYLFELIWNNNIKKKRNL